jgi:hypothetical protein
MRILINKNNEDNVMIYLVNLRVTPRFHLVNF